MPNPKKVLITGAFGQDGYFLTELLEKSSEYTIVCCGRDLSRTDSQVYASPQVIIKSLNILNEFEIVSLVKNEQADIIFNLAAFSSPMQSWGSPEETLHANGLSVLTFLESIKDFSPKTRFFNACSAKIYAIQNNGQQNLTSNIDPKEPYGLGKYIGFQSVKMYREHFGIFASSGILYNHESHLKNDNFVVYKICHNALQLKKGSINNFELFNLDAEIDFGDPRDYVRAMVLMMQQEKSEDMIISSNKSISIREICQEVGQILGIENILEHITAKEKSSNVRPTIQGDNTRLLEIGWKAQYSVHETLQFMLDNIRMRS